jgi:hypothetical protein
MLALEQKKLKRTPSTFPLFNGLLPLFLFNLGVSGRAKATTALLVHLGSRGNTVYRIIQNTIFLAQNSNAELTNSQKQ